MRLWVTAGLLAFHVGPALAQSASIDRAAAEAAVAWRHHDIRALLATSPRILVQLPHANPSSALSRMQATEVLRDYLAGGAEIDVTVRGAREVRPGVGYAELTRRYRVAGTDEQREVTLLLSFRRGPDGWELVELRVVGGGDGEMPRP
ncbi:MAG: hypothetical protein ACOY71_09435 [Gemmatimonadota bacterium]